MRFVRNLFLGLRAYLKALRFILDHKLYWYLIFPALLMLGIYQIGFMIKNHEPVTEARNMNEIIWYMLRLLIEILIASMLMRFAKYMVVMLLSPLFSHISQKVEYLLTGNTYRFSMKQLVHDIKRGFRIGIRNIMWEMFFFSIAITVGTLGWKDYNQSPLVYALIPISFYYYGFAFMDYVNERLKFNMEQSIQIAQKNRGIAIAIGSVYSLLIWSFIDLSHLYDWSSFSSHPWVFIGSFVSTILLWLAASFAPIWAIVAATIAMDDLLDLKSTREMSINSPDL